MDAGSGPGMTEEWGMTWGQRRGGGGDFEDSNFISIVVFSNSVEYGAGMD